MDIRVAGIQMPVSDDVNANVKYLSEAINRASVENVDILLSPEGSVSGYRYDFDAKAVRDGVQEVTKCAQEHSVGLALGTCYIEYDGLCYNQIRFYQQDGAYLGYHTKILRCGSMTMPTVGEINHYSANELRIFQWHEGLTIGGLICNDLWANPECTPMQDSHLSQKLSEMGAHIIFHAVNGGRNASEWSQVAWQFHDANLRMRARAGKLWIVTVDSSAPMHIPCSAPSGVLSPEGTWVRQTASSGLQFFTYTIKNIGDDSQN